MDDLGDPMRTMTVGILACILIGLLVILAGEVAYLASPVTGLALVGAGMLLSGLALASAYDRVGTRAARVAAALAIAFTLTAAAAPSYQAYRLANGEAFLPQLMIGFMLFAIALVGGSVALRREKIIATTTAVLVPATFVAWLVLSTAFPEWGGIGGTLAYGALVLVEARAMHRAQPGAGPTAAPTPQ